jgi:hypothetical protein
VYVTFYSHAGCPINVNITFPQENAVKMMTSGAGNSTKRGINPGSVKTGEAIATIDDDPYGNLGNKETLDMKEIDAKFAGKSILFYVI